MTVVFSSRPATHFPHSKTLPSQKFPLPLSQMPPRRRGGRRHQKKHTKSQTHTVSAMPNSPLPHDVIASILTRLPVKSLMRFKCVSKPWLAEISSPKFIAMHRKQTSKNRSNHSFVIHSEDGDCYHVMSLLNVNSTEKQPIQLLNPFPVIFYRMDLVGSVNGLVCLSCPPLAQMIVLWNPALNQSKGIRLSNSGLRGIPEIISVGFGYDDVKDDYKVVRIACLEPKGKKPEQSLRVQAEVYSVILDSWKRIKVNFPFHVSSTRCTATVKGVPYWTAIMYDSERNLSQVFAWYDMQNEVFKHVPMPQFHLPRFLMHSDTALLVELSGCLASLVYSPSIELRDYVDVLVYDEDEASWKKKSTHGPIGLKMHRIVQCSKERVILALTPESELFLYDSVTNAIKKFCIPDAQKDKNSYEAFGYTESLVYLEGMEKVQEQDKEKYCFKSEDLDDEDADEDAYEGDAFAMSILSLA